MCNARILIFAQLMLFASVFPSIGFLAQSAESDEKKKVVNELRAGELREFEIADGVKMKFCWIPAGEQQLGSLKEDRDVILEQIHKEEKVAFVSYRKELDYLSTEVESNRPKFKTNGFWLGTYPVTQAEWHAVMGENPSYFNGTNDNNAKGLNTERFPVEYVSWDDCQYFLEKINKRNGIIKVFGKDGKFVLPHEDQWEYASRGGKGNKQPFYWGGKLNGTEANCNGNYPYGTEKKGDYKARTTEVGSYAKDWPHPWGLCDMHGNVWQWCDNKYEQLDERMLRGGSWDSIPRLCRSTQRNASGPASRRNLRPELCFDDFGFRVCLSLN